MAAKDIDSDSELMSVASRLQLGDIGESDHALATSLGQAVDSDVGQTQSSSLNNTQMGGSSPKNPQTEVASAKCTGCLETFPVEALARCPCADHYCRECLTCLFQASLTGHDLFPPRCCQQAIPVDANLLPAQLIEKFRAQLLEYETQDKMYCHNPNCSTFVPPQSIQGHVATCVKCHLQTCVKCKAAMHDGACALDAEAQDVIRLAVEKGWQRCYRCHGMVERATGCNHMTCACHAEFCYLCGLKWKTCECEGQANLDHIVQQPYPDPNMVPGTADRDPYWIGPPLNLNTVEYYEYYQCEHHEWSTVPGREECEYCDRVRQVFRCEECGLRVCRRCRWEM